MGFKNLKKPFTMLNKIRTVFKPIIFIPILFLIRGTPAFATQTHGDPEGIIIHQVAHIFFLISMGTLIYWLRERKLILHKGWRYIQYSALLFILWNLDAFIVHFLDSQSLIIHAEIIENWNIKITAKGSNLFYTILYYFVKLDHLFCVPAMFFLYFGLKNLYTNPPSNIIGGGK